MTGHRAAIRRLWREALQHEGLIEEHATRAAEILQEWRDAAGEPEDPDGDTIDFVGDLVAQVPFLQARIRELEAELASYRPGARFQPRSVQPPAEVWDGRDPEPPEE
jgi:hypothetical protein